MRLLFSLQWLPGTGQRETCYNYNVEGDEVSRIASNCKRIVAEKSWLRKRLVSILMAALAIGIMVGIFLNRDSLSELGGYGYLGAFLISLIANATIILPIPGILILVGMGSVPGLHPVLIGLVAAAGGTLGELTGYMLGYGGRVLVENRKAHARAVAWINKWGVLAILIFALVPFLPLDIAGIAAGNLRFPLWKFMAVCWCGKAILYTVAAYAGAWGWEIVVPFFG